MTFDCYEKSTFYEFLVIVACNGSFISHFRVHCHVQTFDLLFLENAKKIGFLSSIVKITLFQ